MTSVEPVEQAALATCLVTGGCGFLGRYLTIALAKRGHKVVILDLVPPETCTPKGILEPYLSNIVFVQGDLRDISDVRNAVIPHRVDVIFHTASLLRFHSDSWMTDPADRRLIEDINVGGTRNILTLAAESPTVRHVIYTSSTNVIFPGTTGVRDGDEEMPYPAGHIDYYSATKAVAERLVVEFDGCYGNDGRRRIRTCVLRSSGGIYGPGESMTVPRMLDAARRGIVGRIGGPEVRVDMVAVENLVHGHLLAYEGLLRESNDNSTGSVGDPTDDDSLLGTPSSEDEYEELKKEIRSGRVAGEIFHISDGIPVNQFGFFEPLLTEMGYSFRMPRVPFTLMFVLVIILEFLYWVLRVVFRWKAYPYLTRIEVCKVGVDNYYSIDKAVRVLGYAPIISQKAAVQRMIEYYVKNPDFNSVIYRHVPAVPLKSSESGGQTPPATIREEVILSEGEETLTELIQRKIAKRPAAEEEEPERQPLIY